MAEYFRPAWLEINLNNLIYNASEIKSKVKDKDLIGVVKANAYGHGAFEVASVLLKNGFQKLAVAILDEAVELRKAGITCPIMILGITPEIFFEDILKYNLEPAVTSYDYVSTLSRMAVQKNKTVKVHVAVDTGMGRIGFLPNDQDADLVYKISRLPNIEIESLFTHFSTADEVDKSYSKMQFNKYVQFYNKLVDKGVKINMENVANSAAIMELPVAYMDEVRPGIIIYGYYPSEEVDKKKLNIKPVMTLKSRIVHLKTLDSGNYISYGRRFKTNRKTVIATLPIGYADGYSRMLSGKARVILRDKSVPVVGNICMDQCMVDVTDVENVKVGDEVILMGQKGDLKFNADDMASILGTINYEVLCMMSRRLPRIYIKDGEIVKIKNYIN